MEPDTFRQAMRRVSASVAVITAPAPDGPVGATATSVTSVAMDPPLLLVCLNRRIRLNPAVRAARRFGVNFLAAHQQPLAQRHGGGSEGFAAEQWDRGGDIPLLRDALVTLACETVEEIEAGTHTIFLARPAAIRLGSGTPLLYHAARYGGFAAH